MNKPKWIVIHTAAADRKGVTLEDIRQWHLDRGWRDIGYHYVIEDDGLIQVGRGLEEIGAHVVGLNSRSVGICVTGHGDHRDFNEAQYRALDVLLPKLCNDFDLSSDHIIGHREAGKIEGVPNPGKSCPGIMVEMVPLRERNARAFIRRSDEPKESHMPRLRIARKTSKKKVVEPFDDASRAEILEDEIVRALETLSGMRYLHGSTIISPMIRRILGGGEYSGRSIAEAATGILEEMKRNA